VVGLILRNGIAFRKLAVYNIIAGVLDSGTRFWRGFILLA
jgi:hypothetical protein